MLSTCPTVTHSPGQAPSQLLHAASARTASHRRTGGRCPERLLRGCLAPSPRSTLPALAGLWPVRKRTLWNSHVSRVGLSRPFLKVKLHCGERAGAGGTWLPARGREAPTGPCPWADVAATVGVRPTVTPAGVRSPAPLPTGLIKSPRPSHTATPWAHGPPMRKAWEADSPAWHSLWRNQAATPWTSVRADSGYMQARRECECVFSVQRVDSAFERDATHSESPGEAPGFVCALFFNIFSIGGF